MDSTTWTAIGALAAIAAATAAWLLLQHTIMRDLPVISAEWSQDVRPGDPRQIDFQFARPSDSDRWSIGKARITGWRRHRLAETLGYKKEPGFVRYFNGPWLRAVPLDPPVTRGQVAVHHDSPDSFWLRFTIRSRASRWSRRCVTVRMTAKA